MKKKHKTLKNTYEVTRDALQDKYTALLKKYNNLKKKEMVEVDDKKNIDDGAVDTKEATTQFELGDIDERLTDTCDYVVYNIEKHELYVLKYVPENHTVRNSPEWWELNKIESVTGVKFSSDPTIQTIHNMARSLYDQFRDQLWSHLRSDNPPIFKVHAPIGGWKNPKWYGYFVYNKNSHKFYVFKNAFTYNNEHVWWKANDIEKIVGGFYTNEKIVSGCFNYHELDVCPNTKCTPNQLARQFLDSKYKISPSDRDFQNPQVIYVPTPFIDKTRKFKKGKVVAQNESHYRWKP